MSGNATPSRCAPASALSFVLLLASIPALSAQNPPQPPSPATGQALQPILSYISNAWDTLTRSMTDCKSFVDPKIRTAPVLYLPAHMPEPPAVQDLAKTCGVEIKYLPIEIHRLGQIDTDKIQPNGLLYLPNKYVVPGGRFNEMYGWDSYFIIRGLLLAGRVDLAKDMVDNFLFEIENYGAMLNANRTYYLTRSQPPFVSSMFVEVYEALRKSGHDDPAWLARAYVDLETYYQMWMRDPHLAGDTGLSRYYDFGQGPPAEAVQDEAGYYRKVATYFFFHPSEANHYLVENLPGIAEPVAGKTGLGKTYALQVCDLAQSSEHSSCDPPREFKLSSDFYKGDRSLRESGFDVTFRFAPFGAATHRFAPVCLNSLLYKNEKDLEQISRWLAHPADAQMWSRRADARRKLITKYLWNQKSGLFFDYDFTTGQQSSYRYASTFYPLWAGLATPAQAKAVEQNISIFEKPGGLTMSTDDSGAQWDLPYGWGNIQMLAVEGLRRYGFNHDADRISSSFLSMVADNFRRDGTIREKYNVVTRSSETNAQLGYPMNVVGFGWTNAAFTELLHDLPTAMRERLDEQDASTGIAN